jgi:hypothetical protein
MWNMKKMFKKSENVCLAPMTAPIPNSVESESMFSTISTKSAPAPGQLTVLELFQSQGCSSCPPTNSNIIDLSSDPSYLVLTYEVTYWDYLGWKDTFGNSTFDKRQWEYARALGSTKVYTPQVKQKRRKFLSLLLLGSLIPTTSFFSR